MDTALAVLEPPELPAELIAPLKLAADFAKASKAPATQFRHSAHDRRGPRAQESCNLGHGHRHERNGGVASRAP